MIEIHTVMQCSTPIETGRNQMFCDALRVDVLSLVADRGKGNYFCRLKKISTHDSVLTVSGVVQRF